MSFDDERQLLLRWRDLVLESDPDILIGYNIVNFDLPYLLNRAETLKIPHFWTWGRMRNRWVGVGGAADLALNPTATPLPLHHSLTAPAQALQDEGRAVQQQGLRHARL